jgi:hypothetical protein
MSVSLSQRHRVIWLWALGYFIFYTPYAALVKLMAMEGRWPTGVPLLPLSLLATVATLLTIVTILGWWRYAMVPTRPLLISGAGTALIIASTTLAYTFAGVSVILALLLMRGGVLIIAPTVDALLRRKVRWFSWAALIVSLSAVGLAIYAAQNKTVTGVVLLNLAAYLTGYSMRLPCMTYVGKVDDKEVTRRYFVTEILVAASLLVTVPALLALGGVTALRHGYAEFSVNTLTIGFFYACLYTFCTLIYLDRRENTFTIPLFCGSSLLAGISASFLLSQLAGFAGPATADLIAAAMMAVALMCLSPLHHIPEWCYAYARRTLFVRTAGPR